MEKTLQSRFLMLTLSILLNFTNGNASTQKLDLIQSKLFDLSSSRNFHDWLIHPYFEKDIFLKKSLFIFSRSPSFLDFYNQIRTGDSTKVAKAVSNTIGTPNSFMYKLETSFTKRPFHHSFSYSSSQFLFINPDTPTVVDSLMNQTLAGKISKRFFFNRSRILIIPQVIYGLRKSVNRSFSVNDLLLEQPDQTLSNSKWRYFSELNLLLDLNLKILNITLDLKSFPLINSDYIYWDLVSGVKSKKIHSPFKNSYFSSLDFFFNTSPISGNNHDKKKTIRYGTNLYLNKYLNFNVFFLEGSKIGFLLVYKNKNLSVSLHSYEKTYLDEYPFKKRGIDFNYKF
ncbi:MAG: hypothetical protein CME68_11980 [Halobacteriovoraceae bacterium]|nr:hypothetical protein [Halobacteriovoraceae bacterium]